MLKNKIVIQWGGLAKVEETPKGKQVFCVAYKVPTYRITPGEYSQFRFRDIRYLRMSELRAWNNYLCELHTSEAISTHVLEVLTDYIFAEMHRRFNKP